MATQITLPRDAEGREVPLDTKVLYDADGDPRHVAKFVYHQRCTITKGYWTVVCVNGIEKLVSKMHLTQLDSWKKLIGDLDRCIKGNSLCMYYSQTGLCRDCASYDDDSEGCDAMALRSIKERIRKLAKEDER